jgi:hypothetical protein
MEVDVKFHAFVTSALGGGEWSVLRSSFFTYGKKQEAGWDTEPINSVRSCCKLNPIHKT